MSNKEKLAWCFGAGILILLFLLSSTDLIIKEKKREVYPVSVVVEDENDEFYVNFKKGMEKAASSFQADVSFITLYQRNDGGQQLELLSREAKDGARALVAAPVDETDVIMGLKENALSVPVLFFGAQSAYDLAAAAISPDHYGMGRALGEQIVEKEDKTVPVYILTEGLSYTGSREAESGLRSVLAEAGFTCRVVEKQPEDAFRRLIEETVYPGDGRILLVALDAPSLSEAARILSGSSVYREHVAALYGLGSTVEILNRLDEGIIKGLVTYDQYNAGYLCIRRAVEAIQGNRFPEPEILDFYYIEKSDLKSEKYEKMLYPME